MTHLAEQAEAASAAGNGRDALRLASAAGDAGNPRGWALLGYWHLSGLHVPRDLLAARRYMRKAAQGGDADAALTEISLIANGTGGVSDWALALQLLRAAAQKFGGAATEHLALINAMQLAEDGNPANLAAGKLLSTAPEVRLWHHFITEAEATHIAQSVQEILEPSMVADPRTGRFMAHPIRDSLTAPIGPTRETLPIQAILRRIAVASGTHVSQGESMTVLRYGPGQQYRDHLDTLPHTANQRSCTMILYLNEGYGGGETTFSATGLSVAGRAGDALFFRNTTTDGQPDPLSRHAGQPVRSGAKWIATRWIRAAPFDIWNPN